jgi:hypothetical protein
VSIQTFSLFGTSVSADATVVQYTNHEIERYVAAVSGSNSIEFASVYPYDNENGPRMLISHLSRTNELSLWNTTDVSSESEYHSCTPSSIATLSNGAYVLSWMLNGKLTN